MVLARRTCLAAFVVLLLVPAAVCVVERVVASAVRAEIPGHDPEKIVANVRADVRTLLWASTGGLLFVVFPLGFLSRRRTIDLGIRDLSENIGGRTVNFRDDEDSVHRAYVECVGSLAKALDARDCYTAGHSHRVSEYSCEIARAMGFSPAQQDELRIGALLHDIGKIGVPDSVLRNPGRLTSDEMSLIQQHPAIGRTILQGVNGFAPYLSTVELHHENWDGSGYPYGLKGENTPLAARIVHVADAYDAMTSDRPYRRGMSSEDAVRVLDENAGTQFDPSVVQVFCLLAKSGAIRTGTEVSTNLSLRQLAESVLRESELGQLKDAEDKSLSRS